MNARLLAGAERADARLLIRWAATTLTDNERVCLEAFAAGEGAPVTARRIGITKGGVWMLRQSGLRKIRTRLERIGITSTGMLLSG